MTENSRDHNTVKAQSGSGHSLVPPDDGPGPPDEEEARRALRYHIEGRAAAIREKYDRLITGETILEILSDEDAVRHPVTLRIDGAEDVLKPGEFAYPRMNGTEVSDGFTLFLHPYFRDKPETWPALIAYHIPSINYGEIISSEEAELYGATLLGLELDQYYELVCRLADMIPDHLDAATP